MIESASVSRQVIGVRYHNDGVPIRKINEIQGRMISSFVSDERIGFTPVHQCTLCKSEKFVVVAEKDQFGIPLDTALCKRCGLVFSFDQLDDNGAKIFYTDYYRKIYEGVDGPTLDHSYYKRLFSGGIAVPKIPKFIKKESVVLEIGCGGGWNLVPYQKAGINYTGFDYDEHMVNFGREKYGLNIHLGGVDAAREMGVKADLVILSHVLEHVTDPVLFLKDIGAVMKDGALLRITVPCLDYLKYFGGSGTSFDFGLCLQNAHNFTFSERTLQMTLMKAGFSPVVTLYGFCLAKKCNNTIEIDSKLSSRQGLDSLNVLITSEKLLPYKNFIFNKTPARLKFLLSYLHLMSRPVELVRYYLVMYTGIGRRLLDRV